jgi:hypothetical protein
LHIHNEAVLKEETLIIKYLLFYIPLDVLFFITRHIPQWWSHCIQSSIFWGITPRSPLKVNRRFRETCLLHLQGRRISRARKQREAGSKKSWFLAWLILRCWQHVSPKRRLAFNGLHCVISQKIELFVIAAVRTSSLRNVVSRSLSLPLLLRLA